MREDWVGGEESCLRGRHFGKRLIQHDLLGIFYCKNEVHVHVFNPKRFMTSKSVYILYTVDDIT